MAESGLAPVTRASGRTRQVRFRYAANKHLRHAIDWWMTVASRDDPWSKQRFDQARAAGRGRYRAYRGPGSPDAIRRRSVQALTPVRSAAWLNVSKRCGVGVMGASFRHPTEAHRPPGPGHQGSIGPRPGVSWGFRGE